MNSLTLSPMLAAFFGGWEIILLLASLLVAALVFGLVIGIIVWLVRRSQPRTMPGPAQPVATTQRICPQCGNAMAADAPQGLCPSCLMKVGLGSEGGDPSSESSKERKPAPPSAEIAKHFPQLEILELLGQGGMGMVYKARQRQLDRVVALKILPLASGRDPAFAERFSREARALARLNHPNIVAVYDFGQADGLYYFIMEFVDGVNLRQLEQSRRLAPPEALTIIPKICDALQYAHDEGFVHRDIKPENILLDKKGRVKIADFGLAKLLGRAPKDLQLTGSRHVMGTPHYMAPEQVEHPLEVDHRADIYSLGVVFYEMLTGELPLGRFAPPSQKVQMDVRLDEVILRALEKEPERRYQYASEVKTDVETIAGKTSEAAANRREPRAGLSAASNSPANVRLPYLSLALFLTGLLGTILLIPLIAQDEWALIFGGVALLFALLFGALSWKERMSKAVVFATLTVFAGLGFTVAILVWGTPWSSSRRKLVERKSQEVRNQHVAEEARLRAGLLGGGDSGWFLAGSNRKDYETSLDRNVTHSGKASACLKSIVSRPAGFGTLKQMFKADSFRGKRLRLSGYVRSKEVTDWAGLWMRVDGSPRNGEASPPTLAFDNMQDRPITATTDWTRYELVLDVPEEAREIAFGILLAGPGQVWLADSNFEVVGKEVATTGGRLSQGLLETPKLDFEKSAGDRRTEGNASQTLDASPPVVVRTKPASGARSVTPGIVEISATFSKEMADGSWSWTAAWQNSAPELVEGPSYAPDRRTCVIKVKLDPGKTYAYWLNTEKIQNFRDKNGNPALPYLLIFQTKQN